MPQHPPAAVDMITGLLLDDVARPEMLGELFKSSMLQYATEQDARAIGGALVLLANPLVLCVCRNVDWETRRRIERMGRRRNEVHDEHGCPAYGCNIGEASHAYLLW